MSDKHSIDADKAPKPVGLYPHARKVGNWLYLSGIGPREPGTDHVPGLDLDKNGLYNSFDFEAQCHSVFKNVKTVLEASGAQWSDLIDVQVFLTNMKRDFKTYNRLWGEYFKVDPPCRTTVEIKSLPTPIAIELKCVAFISSKG